MAKSTAAASIISLNDVRDSVRRVQHEGERLVTRIRGESERVADRVRRQAEEVAGRVRDEARRWVGTPAVFDDVRRQAEQALAELQKRRALITTDLEKRRTALASDLRERATVLAGRITRALGAAEAERVKTLSREVTGLELRVAELERKLVDVMGQLRERAKRKDKEKDAAA